MSMNVGLMCVELKMGEKISVKHCMYIDTTCNHYYHYLNHYANDYR